MQANRNLVLVGGVGSGKSDLADFIIGEEIRERRQTGGREVKIGSPDKPNTCLRIFEANQGNRNDECLDVLRSQTVDTCFLVVVDITKGEEFVNELASLRGLSEHLADESYSLFGNCCVVFTHIDELAVVADKQEIADREFGEILSLVDGRCMFVNSTLRTQENRDRMLGQLLQLSKPVLRVLCYGNLRYPSTMVQEITNVLEYSTQLEHSGVKLNFFPDVYNPFVEQQIILRQELSRLIGQPDEIGNGVSVIVILINLKEGFGTGYWEVVNSLPRSYGLDPISEKYFWDRVVVIFHILGGTIQASMKHHIDRNPAIKELVTRIRGRYTHTSPTDSKQIFIQEFISLCERVKSENNFRQVIGGKDVITRATKDIVLKRKETALSNRICNFLHRNRRKVFVTILLLGMMMPIAYRYVNRWKFKLILKYFLFRLF